MTGVSVADSFGSTDVCHHHKWTHWRERPVASLTLFFWSGCGLGVRAVVITIGWSVIPSPRHLHVKLLMVNTLNRNLLSLALPSANVKSFTDVAEYAHLPWQEKWKKLEDLKIQFWKHLQSESCCYSAVQCCYTEQQILRSNKSIVSQSRVTICWIEDAQLWQLMQASTSIESMLFSK